MAGCLSQLRCSLNMRQFNPFRRSYKRSLCGETNANRTEFAKFVIPWGYWKAMDRRKIHRPVEGLCGVSVGRIHPASMFGRGKPIWWIGLENILRIVCANGTEGASDSRSSISLAAMRR